MAISRPRSDIGRLEDERAWGALAGQVGALERDMGEVKNDFRLLSADIAKRFDRLDERFTEVASRGSGKGTNWTAIVTILIAALTGIGALCATMLTIGQMALAPVVADLNKTASAFDGWTQKVELKEDATATLARQTRRDEIADLASKGWFTRSEHEAFTESVRERFAAEKAIDDTLSARLTSIEDNLVKRPEILALIANTIDRTEALSRNLEDIRKQLAETFPSAARVTALENGMGRINERLFTLSSVPVLTAPPPAK